MFIVPVIVCLPLSGAICVVLDVIERLGSLVHHQAKRVGQVTAGSIRVPGGIDDINLSLNLEQNIFEAHEVGPEGSHKWADL